MASNGTGSTASRRPGWALAIETSGAIGSVALGRGPDLLTVRVFDRPRAHAVAFFPTIENICREHGAVPYEIAEIYVSAGPGSFTGLRIGITAARTIAFATGARIVAVPTLEVIAQNAADAERPPAQPAHSGLRPAAQPAQSGLRPPDRVAVVLDAKRKHVYAAAFTRSSPGGSSGGATADRYEPHSPPIEAAPGEFLGEQDPSCAVMGEGVLYHREAVEASGLRVLPEALYRPRAEVVFRLGRERASRSEFADPRSLIPIYIRPPEAQEKWEHRMKGRHSRL